MDSKIKALGSLLVLGSAFSCQRQEKPNIIFFLVDDYGWVDSSVCYDGNQYPNNLNFHTPNMEKLAQMGVRFSKAYACPVSTPTRTSLMSGMNSAHSRITNWTSLERDIPSDATGGNFSAATFDEDDSNLFRLAPWNINGLQPEAGIPYSQQATPMVELLRDNGYYTIHVGKAHWAPAGTPGSTPYNMGFVVSVCGNNAGSPKSYYAQENFGNRKDKWSMSAVQDLTQYYGREMFLTEAITQEALKRLDYPVEHHQPFYLYMAHFATHTPIQADPRFVDVYADMGLDDGQASYSSMVQGVDKSLGDIMEYLDKKGIAKNTIIIFMADNGGNADNVQRGGIRHTQNAPLREGKGSCYEGGIRVPMTVYWPGHTAPSTQIDVPVMPEDLFPTILSMAGVKDYTTVQQVDGKDLTRLIADGSQYMARHADGAVPQSISGVDPEREIIFHYPHQWKGDFRAEVDFLSTIIIGDWKLVYVMTNALDGAHVDPSRGMIAPEVYENSDIPGVKCGALELYNIREDISEQHNVAAQNPDKVRELAHALSDRLREYDAAMPVVRATGKPAKMPDELL